MKNKKLFIVESPNKVKTVSKILGPEFLVKASVGHIRDLPERKLGVDIDHDFEPEYEISKGKKKVVDELRKAAGSCESVYLATDPDREGEAIAWHLYEVLKPSCKDKPFYRVQYNEVTPRGVTKALESAGEINMARVDAQQARRVLDRIVGYKVSPVLWRQVRKGLSAGRVQSVAVRLVCDREEEIEKFVSQPYWVFSSKVRKLVDPRTPFITRLVKIGGRKAEVNSEEEASALRESFKDALLTVGKVIQKTIGSHPYPPLITSTMQQSASTMYGFSPSRTMSVAQKLYEGVDMGEGATGLITYMRTDSVNISSDARDAAKSFITETYGAEYYPEKPNLYKSRGTAQEAHEAIRPTDVCRTPQSLSGVLDASEMKLYDLIWKRFVASQMASAKIDRRTALIDVVPVSGETCQLSVTSSETIFPGFMKVSGIVASDKQESDDEPENGEAAVLPPLSEGEKLVAVEWNDERKETKPPARYNEASLVKALEEDGIGRPSTYASIISTIMQRKYVDRDRRALIPTEIGKTTNSVLVGTFPVLFDAGFTASMETELDKVEEGSEEWRRMMTRFYEKFSEWMSAIKIPQASQESVTKVLEALSHVKEWAPPAKRGRRTYSDSAFVDSIHEQFAAGEKPVTEKQLQALAKILLRYREQVAESADVLKEIGCGEILATDEKLPPLESTVKKLDVLKKGELPEDTAKFVNSIASQVDGGRRLSPAQLRVLDDILAAQVGKIEGLTESSLRDLGIEPRQAVPAEDIKELLSAFESVKEWKEPVKRGKRVFDDQAFLKSVSGQFEKRGSLSPAQINAIKKMVSRYHNQVENFSDISKKFGIVAKVSKKDTQAADSEA